jgi:hypothetical protein
LLANDVMKKLFIWLLGNRLILNLKKTTYVFFHKNKANEILPPPVTLQGMKLECSSTTKYLGFIIDDKLSFKSHISQLAVKLRKWVSIFWRIGSLLNDETK